MGRPDVRNNPRAARRFCTKLAPKVLSTPRLRPVLAQRLFEKVWRSKAFPKVLIF
ncbi:hypothetical protein PCL1606_19470 [Pseudomonas chlororaphis]|uniref:Uncharacterized protein n=1 Tax=Pseudomonas chlororaphis TaxID=587753 RepID=A0A0D5XXE6_9PSED|nr:hypothetical protein PCL1606_19470 [Pseudomonas chlororaphis]